MPKARDAGEVSGVGGFPPRKVLNYRRLYVRFNAYWKHFGGQNFRHFGQEFSQFNINRINIRLWQILNNYFDPSAGLIRQCYFRYVQFQD